MLSRETANTNFIVYDLTWSWSKSIIAWFSNFLGF